MSEHDWPIYGSDSQSKKGSGDLDSKAYGDVGFGQIEKIIAQQ